MRTCVCACITPAPLGASQAAVSFSRSVSADGSLNWANKSPRRTSHSLRCGHFGYIAAARHITLHPLLSLTSRSLPHSIAYNLVYLSIYSHFVFCFSAATNTWHFSCRFCWHQTVFFPLVIAKANYLSMQHGGFIVDWEACHPRAECKLPYLTRQIHVKGGMLVIQCYHF